MFCIICKKHELTVCTMNSYKWKAAENISFCGFLISEPIDFLIIYSFQINHNLSLASEIFFLVIRVTTTIVYRQFVALMQMLLMVI